MSNKKADRGQNKEPNKIYNKKDLQGMKKKQLDKLGTKIGIKSSYSYRKSELIDQILKVQAGEVDPEPTGPETKKQTRNTPTEDQRAYILELAIAGLPGSQIFRKIKRDRPEWDIPNRTLYNILESNKELIDESKNLRNNYIVSEGLANRMKRIEIMSNIAFDMEEVLIHWIPRMLNNTFMNPKDLADLTGELRQIMKLIAEEMGDIQPGTIINNNIDNVKVKDRLKEALTEGGLKDGDRSEIIETLREITRGSTPGSDRSTD